MNAIGQVFKYKMGPNFRIQNFQLVIQLSNVVVPADLLADHLVSIEIKLKCLMPTGNQTIAENRSGGFSAL
jgi:hypothetical protein